MGTEAAASDVDRPVLAACYLPQARGGLRRTHGAEANHVRTAALAF